MANYSNLRIFQSNMNVILKTKSQKSVNVFIREASDTHFARVYIIITIDKNIIESNTYIYGVFSNFTTDKMARKKSLNMATKVLKEVQAILQINGIDVIGGE